MTVDTSQALVSPARSMFNRIIGQPRPFWVVLVVSLVLFLAPFAATYLDGSWDIFRGGFWRPLLIPSVVIVYILAAGQLMARSESQALTVFRPVVLVSDEEFDRIVRDASRTSCLGEVIAFGTGALFGLWLGSYWLQAANTLWLKLYGPLSQSVMMGLLGWTIYDAISSTRVIADLHHQPLRIDLFDIRPFEPMGRQSLVVALVFAGGFLLGALFGVSVDNPFSLLLNLPMMFIPVAVFFLSMRHTHNALLGEKKQQIQAVSQKINQTSHAIQLLITSGLGLGALADEYSALVTYEEQLRKTRTWPYNTTMIRTIFITVLAPLLMRALSDLIFGK
jgi:hypothetical protein